jgi:hypothetical protein
MITVTLLLLLGTALAVVLAAMVRAPAGAPAPPQRANADSRPKPAAPDPLDFDPWDARKGDVVSVHAASSDFSDIDFPVAARDAYEAKSHRWVSLSGVWRGANVGLEIYRFPQPEIIGYFDSRTLSVADLGLTEDQLAAMDERQDPSASFSFEGKRWRYDSSREITFIAGEAGSGEGLYRWLFAEDHGSGLIVVDKWEDEPFEVRFARRVARRDITVYRAA